MSSYSLNDLAARLVAFDASDGDYHDVLEALHVLADDPVLPEGVRALMGDALFRWMGVAADARERAALDVQRIVVAAQHRLDLRDGLALAMAQAPAAAAAPGAPPGPAAATAARVTDTAVSGAAVVEPPAAPLAPAAVTPHRPSPPVAPVVGDHRDDEVDLAALTASLLPGDVDRALLVDFITESRELLEQAEAALLGLESDPDDAEAVNTIFRAFHTIKGTSAFLALHAITEFAHHAETVLSRVRDREIRCVGGYADLALRSCDLLRALLEASQDALEGNGPAMPHGYVELLRVVRNPEAAGISEAGGSAPGHDGGGRPQAAALPRDGVTGSGARRGGGERSGGEATVRVRTERLDRLIEMVGELVIAESMISQDPVVRHGGHLELNRKVAHAEKIVRELQDLSMAMRMVPLKAPFQKVARLVRDLGIRSGKRVEFVAEGEETEIDRNMVDFLGDPLVHMVRNSVDHGIEPAEVRRAAGKPAHGTVRLSAYHASGNVVVELHDDGRGLDREKIVRKAVQQGLIASGEGMTDQEVFELIFAPGFSTADRVTDVSGRGVGMDVVRRNIEALRGRIDIQSVAGQGTTFLVRLPLTLAITDGMLVRVGSERYIVPTINIHLSFRPARSALSTVAGRGEMVMLRDEVMPLVRLHRVFGVPGATEDPTQALLMVVGDGNQRTALLVDELLGQQQVVAKSLGSGIGRVGAISGGAILGDGRVGLILDVNELITLARSAEPREPVPVSTRAVA